MTESYNDTTVITRDDYLAMTPCVYLAAGFRDEQGGVRPELATLWATAGATQLEPLPTGEIATTLLALGQALPLHTQGTPAQRYHGAVAEAGELAGAVLHKAPSPKLTGWLVEFTPFVRTDQDLQDLLGLLAITACQHSLFAGMRTTHA